MPGNTVVTHAFGAPGSYHDHRRRGQLARHRYTATLWNGERLGRRDASRSSDRFPSRRTTSQYSGADTEDGGSVAPDQLHVSLHRPGVGKSRIPLPSIGATADADDDGTTTFSLNPGQTEFRCIRCRSMP